MPKLKKNENEETKLKDYLDNNCTPGKERRARLKNVRIQNIFRFEQASNPLIGTAEAANNS